MRNKLQDIGIRGYGRVRLLNAKTGKIEGDSGWKRNTITETGFEDYLSALLGNIAGSTQALVLALGTQTAAPSSTQTIMVGEEVRLTTVNAIVASQTLRQTQTWATDEANGVALGSIGAYNITNVGGGSIMNVLTYATSNKTTDQTLAASMEFRFS